MTRLVLGTAQFGAGYGITNAGGRIPDDGVRGILAVAADAGVDLFDTAPDYNDAQARLGALQDPARPAQFVSKFGFHADGVIANADALFERTLSDLRVAGLYGLLFHRPADLRDERAAAVWELLLHARANGVIARIGASIYDADDLEIVAERFPDVGLIQVPGNVLDRRLLDHPTLHALHASGAEVHVRSAYLQGLLLSEPENLPAFFGGLRPALEAFRSAAADQGQTPLALALGFLKRHPIADGVLVGAANAAEFASTVAAWNDVPEGADEFPSPELDRRLLDPRHWPVRERKA